MELMNKYFVLPVAVYHSPFFDWCIRLSVQRSVTIARQMGEFSLEFAIQDERTSGFYEVQVLS